MKTRAPLFVRASGLVSLVLAAGILLADVARGEAANAVAAKRPNILLFFADDLGFSDIGCYGSEISTPNLDRLAADGVRLTQFYNTGRCCPSRASLLTGLHPHQAGVGDMVDEYARKVREQLDSPAYTDRLNPLTPTIAEVLRPAGYRTGMTGKWHLGYEHPNWPSDRGFDRSFTVLEGAMNYWGHGMQHTGKIVEPPMALDDQRFSPPREGFFATDAFTDFAVKFVEAQRGRTQPFFFYFPFNAPHWPLHAAPEDIAKYRGRYRDGWDAVRARRHARLKELGLVARDSELAPRPATIPAWETISAAEQDDWDLRMAIFAAQVDHMDRSIGRVLASLRAIGAERDTLVIFLSDNGGAPETPRRSLPGATLGSRESYESYGLRGAHVSNTPHRLQKVTVHEGGIATPFIARWPGRVPASTVSREIGFLPDLMATFVDVGAASFPKTFGGRTSLPPEGVSLLPAFAGNALAARTLCWEHEGNRAVRQGKWKLVARHQSPWELYDIEADRSELHDLSGKHPDMVAALSAHYAEWAKRCGVLPWPLPKK